MRQIFPILFLLAGPALGQTVIGTDAGEIDNVDDFDGALCGTNEVLEDQGATWACIATPGGGGAHGDGANCLAGEIALGVDGSGAVQGCYEPTEADITDLAHTSEVNNLATVTWVNVPDANITQGSVTQHQAALSVTAAQVSDFDTEVSNNASVAANTAKISYTDAAAVSANTAKVTNATHTGDVTGDTGLTIAVDAVDIAMLSATGTPSSSTFLRGDNTWSTPAGGGGAPTENVILTATKTSGQNINGVEGTETNLTWDVVTQDTGELTSFSSGNANVIFTNAGWVNIHASAFIIAGVVNNRSVYGVSLYHYNSADALQYSYHGDMQYNRDDNDAYDASGGSVSQGMMKVAAGDYIYIRTRVFDDATSGTSQTLDTTYSKLRIAQIVF